MADQPLYDPTATKRPTNLSINSDLLRQAKGLGINLSQEFERHLASLVAERRRQAWLEENKESLDAYNRHVEKHGVFSEGLRKF
ncbi:MAG: type II toxin-antitoxin system CcdA family antitoxin [Myxococcota bacterium]